MSGKTVNNAADTAVVESIEGLLLSRPDLCALKDASGSELKVTIKRTLHKNQHVAVISGGGAGHEPAHVGLVADGLLTAAISGHVFSSPNVRQILAGIRASAGSCGALLVVKSYTGDKLAFGLAAETAKAEGIPVETVFVADDAAVDAGHIAGRRGIAGTVLVHKVAGALAQAGAPLQLVHAAASHAAACVVSMGASLTTCSIPGAAASSRLGPGSSTQCELGLGIHGEPGRVELGHVPSADELAKELVTACVTRLGEVGAALGFPQDRVPTLSAGAAPAAVESSVDGTSGPASLPVAVLVNNLGGLSNLEQGIFVGAVAKAIASLPCVPPLRMARLYAGPLMTSLDMKGVSLSLLPVTSRPHEDIHGNSIPGEAGWEAYTPQGKAWVEAGGLVSGGTWDFQEGSEGAPWRYMDVLDCLDAPTACPHWPVPAGMEIDVPKARYIAEAATGASTEGPATGTGVAIPTPVLLAAVQAARDALAQCAAEVGRLDALAGDGDAGDTYALMGKVAAAAVEALAGQSNGSSAAVALDAVLKAIAAAVARDCGGTSGVLYALMLTAATRTAAETGSSVSPLAALASCVRCAVDTASRYGGARAGDRTFLDVLIPVAEALQAQAAAGASGADAARAAASAAQAGADATAGMAPAAGRAAYVKVEAVKGSPDAGAVATATWIQAVAKAVTA